MKRRVPRLMTDEEAEAFLDSDLSELDFSQFKSRRLRLQDGSGPKPENASGLNPTRQRAIEELRRMVLDAVGNRDAEIWLFGSCARGDVRQHSDIDVGILPRGDLPSGLIAELAANIEESTIPYDVDLVDLRRAEPALVEEIRREGVRWRD
jgi:predicted nucleotidyltransferase